MQKVAINGPSGELRWGYQRVASVGPWSITPLEEGGRIFRAALMSHDPSRVSQRPLAFVFVRPDGRAPWRWTLESLQINGTQVEGLLSAEE